MKSLSDAIGKRLGGADGVLNERGQGTRPGAGARLSIVCGDPRKQAMGAVRIPHAVAARIYEAHVVGAVLAASNTAEPTDADRDRTRTLVRQALRRAEHPRHREMSDLLQGAADGRPTLAIRYPTLHRHNALGLQVR